MTYERCVLIRLLYLFPFSVMISLSSSGNTLTYSQILGFSRVYFNNGHDFDVFNVIVI